MVFTDENGRWYETLFIAAVEALRSAAAAEFYTTHERICRVGRQAALSC
jgi:hypothetical protein